MKRVLAVVISTVLLLTVLSLGMAAWIVGTETGLAFAWNKAHGWLPDFLRIGAVEGRLIGPLEVRDIELRTASFTLRIEQAQLDWQPSELRHRTLAVTRMEVSGVQYTQLPGAVPPPPEQPSSGGWPKSIDLPLDVRIDRVRLNDFKFRPNPEAEPFVIDRASLAASLVEQQLTLQRLAIQGPTLRVAAKGKLTLKDRWPTNAAIDWWFAPPAIAALQGQTRIGGDLRRLKLTQRIAAPYNLRAEAVLRGLTEGDIQAQADLSAQDIHLASIDPQLPPLTLRHLTTSLAGTPNALTLNTTLKAFGGTLQGDAQMNRTDTLAARVDLRANALDPGVLFKDWKGKLGGVAKVSMRQHPDGELTAELYQADIGGRLRDRPIALKAQGTYGLKGVTISQLQVSSGPSELSARGSVGERIDLQYRLHSPDLGTVVPQARGRLDGEGRVQGALTTPHLVVSLHGGELAYENSRLQRLALDADVNLHAPHQPMRLDLTLTVGESSGVVLHQLRLNTKGTLADHLLHLSANSNQGSIELTTQGALSDLQEPSRAAWRYQVSTLNLGHPPFAPWRLSESLPGMVSAARQTLGRTCLASTADAKLCLEAEHGADQLQASADLTRLALAYFSPVLPQNLGLEGMIDNAKARLSQTSSAGLSATVELGTTGGKLRVTPAGDDEPFDLEFKPSSVHAVYGEELKLRALLDLAVGRFEAQARVPPGDEPLDQRPLEGNIVLRLDQLGFVSELVPELTESAGKIDGDLKLGGSLAVPDIRGQLLLTDGRLRLGTPGITVEQLQAKLVGQGRQGMGIDISAVSGDGPLHVKGHADFAEGGPRAKLKIDGEQFMIVDNLDAQAYSSPALDVSIQPQGIKVRGEVRIPRASIHPRGGSGPKSTKVSKDVVIVGRAAQSAEQPSAVEQQLDAKVRVILGEKVGFEGYGLKTNILGDLTVAEVSGEPTSVNGELKLDKGKYRAYGQDLEIDEGKLLFAGSATDPAVAVRAVRTPNPDVTVGVSVTGTLTNPHFELYSEPEMTQKEQLSWLLFGKDLGESTQSEGSKMDQAAMALGLSGGEFLAQKLGSKLGLSEVSIRTQSDESGLDASLVVGKYLTPHLYISYGVSLFRSDSGGDIVYTFER